MSNKPYKGFEPKWVLTPAPADSYRSIFRWGDPNFFKYPKESLYTLMKETFKMTDNDFKAYSDDIGFDPVDLSDHPVQLAPEHIEALKKIVGEQNVSTTDYDRLSVAYGATAYDLLRLRHKRIDRGKLAGLMLFYFFVTYAVLAVAFYASFLIDDYKIDSSFSGVLISLFFLAIMLPGLFIDKIIVRLKQNVNLVSLGLVCAGLLCVGIFRGKAMLVVGALLAGFGYGVMQPVVYDKAATIAPPRSATLALSFVMAMNYLAVMVCPFIVDLFRHLFHTHSDRFPFFFNAAAVLVMVIVTWRCRGNFTLGLDESYYKS